MRYWSKIIKENWFINSGIKTFIFFANIINKNRIYRNRNNLTAIISFHKLGDSVFTIPTIKLILAEIKSDVDLFCMKEAVPIYQLVFGNSLNYVVFSNEDFRFGDRISGPKIIRCFRERKPSTIIDLTGSPKSASLFLLNRAKEIIGFNQKIFSSLYTRFNSIKNIKHISEIYGEAVKGYIDIVPNDLIKYFRIERKTKGNILIHPFAGWDAKEWSIYYFILLAKKLNLIKPTKIIIPSNALSLELKNEINHSGIDVIETRTINELIDCLKNASLIIGNDSGAIYIANLMGIPSFTLFGPSNPFFHFIPSENNGFININLKCSPFEGEKLCFTNGGRDGCPLNICMSSIKVNLVYEKIVTLIADSDNGLN